MKKNLQGRIGLIAAVLLICLYGIFGIPSGLSGKSIVEALTNRIHLGLDLKGGSHLVLQVQVQDAVKAEADQAIERLKEDLQKQNITWASIDRAAISCSTFGRLERIRTPSPAARTM